MVTVFKQLLCIWVGLGSGLLVSGAVFAFIAVIGVVPRLAQKTKTTRSIKIYEEALIVGGIFGTAVDFFAFRIPLHPLAVALYSLCIGMFFGCLAVSLAEVLNVFPVLTRRTGIQTGLFFFIIALALGKLAGSLLYFFVPGYYDI